MNKLVKININKYFKRAYYKGKFKANQYLVTYGVKNWLGYNRVGITTTKKVGGAVQRNRARRVILQAYREIQSDIPKTGYDIVFVARPITHKQKCYDIKKNMIKQIEFVLK